MLVCLSALLFPLVFIDNDGQKSRDGVATARYLKGGMWFLVLGRGHELYCIFF